MGERCQIKFYFDWGIDTCFWPANNKAYARFEFGPIPPEELGLSADTANRVRAKRRAGTTAM